MSLSLTVLTVLTPLIALAAIIGRTIATALSWFDNQYPIQAMPEDDNYEANVLYLDTETYNSLIPFKLIPPNGELVEGYLGEHHLDRFSANTPYSIEALKPYRHDILSAISEFHQIYGLEEQTEPSPELISPQL